jgi:hypothetical protein
LTELRLESAFAAQAAQFAGARARDDEPRAADSCADECAAVLEQEAALPSRD